METQLTKLHLQLYHASSDKQFAMLLRADPRRAIEVAWKPLEYKHRAITSCVEFSAPPFYVRASLRLEWNVFNHEVAVDLFRLEGRPVLYVVDTNTRLRGEVVLHSKSADDMWSAFMEGWVALAVTRMRYG